MTDKHEYCFEYDEISCCAGCPMFYDYIYCELDGEDRDFDDYTWHHDNRRPDFCKLSENTRVERTCYSDNEPPLLYDDPFRVFRCSECHHKVDLRHNRKPNYCPNCGAKVVDE